ncbi:hypothetical protein AX16_003902 [Volvariella volvacea WC 439]|nr:hypothetical protein AX16_003902 [Volvariella volvacea WC 439]
MPTQDREVLLSLPDGRTLAYESAGRKDSPILVIFFHGVFGYGKAEHIGSVLEAKNVHYVAPTLPGWGLSSPRPAKSHYSLELANDITFLIHHLYPDAEQREKVQIYISGGSYGTVPAQMLYGLPPELFPPAKQVKGLLLIAAFSPFRYHTQYAKDMTWPNYIMVGPVAQMVPFRLMPRLAVAVVRPKTSTPEKMEAFLRQSIFDKMGEEEKALFKQYAEKRGKTEDDIKRDFANNGVKSVRQTWTGFLEVSDVIHGDWGFEPKSVPSEGRRVLVVASEGDEMAPESMAKWLVTQYGNAKLKRIGGGHLAALYYLDDIWAEFLEGVRWSG